MSADLPKPVEIDWPEYNAQAMGCGLEDRCIMNRYEAMAYGWNEAIDRARERVPEEPFTETQLREYAEARVSELLAAADGLLADAEWLLHIRQFGIENSSYEIPKAYGILAANVAAYKAAREPRQ